MVKELNTDFNFTGCKYYLPCGKCDKTNELCTHYVPYYPTHPYYQGWWEHGPIWGSSDSYTITNKIEPVKSNIIYTTMAGIKEAK